MKIGSVNLSRKSIKITTAEFSADSKSDSGSASFQQSQSVTVEWTGGEPNSLINIIGTSSSRVGSATVSGFFLCTERVSARKFAVPPAVTLSLPASATQAGTPTGTLGVQSTVSSPFTAPGINIGQFSSSVMALKNLAYQ